MDRHITLKIPPRSSEDHTPAAPAPQKNTVVQVREYADPKHRIAAVALAYAEHPSNSVVIATNPAERRELNRLIRADLQASGTVAPDSRALPVYIEKELTNPKLATQYAPGDIIQYRQGSPASQGIPNDSAAVIVATDTRNPTRITEPGPILAVRLPGIYADVANTKNAIIETNYTNGQITQAIGFAAAFGGNTSHSRTLAPNEKVYVTQITVKRDAAMFELLTVDVATLGDGRGTHYRAELNVELPGLENMSPEDMKKTIDTVMTDPATASAVESKTIKLGMSPDEVKKSLGNPDKIVDLGTKQVFIYKDMKVVFLNSQVSDVQ